VITRKKAFLFRFLKIRAILDGTNIYPLENNKSIVIVTAHNRSTLVITDGFHFTRTFELQHQHREISYLSVVCTLDDDRLLAGAIVTFLLFLTGLTSGILFIQMLSFFPTLYFLYSYYINRRNFIKVKTSV
jgi:hypothetical protein